MVTLLLGVLAVLSILYWWLFAPITAWLPEAVDKAQQIDSLSRFLLASGTALFIYVVGYLIYFSIAFRRRKSDPPDAIGVQIHDNHKLELWWTILPAVFVVVMAIFSIQIWAGIQLGNNNGLVVEALGHQWFYSFRYPDVHGEVSNEMHLPLGIPVTLHVTSYDVIHSFWVPDMRIKADMVPGIINTLRFTPTKVGRYEIICTEFCGTLHGEMNKQYMVVDSPAQYKAWYSGWQRKNAHTSDAIPTQGSGAVTLTGGNAASGKALFSQKCSACHALGTFSQKVVGPGLKDVMADPGHPNLVDGDKATPQNVAKILQQGYKGSMGQMPNQTANGLTDKDIADLVAFLKSTK
ncbi:MAG: cytochrome c oxidase subunit II [Candidatus Eremiobacteraeota bacterium]|nr:cytochrome c oxidase subunit II [Candidatus Eremiobacteraeota bacterium]